MIDECVTALRRALPAAIADEAADGLIETYEHHLARGAAKQAAARAALAEYPSSCLVIVGGVAASPQLRAAAADLCEGLGVDLCLPPLKWSTDNGAMIGLATWDYLANQVITGTLEPVPGLGMEAF